MENVQKNKLIININLSKEILIAAWIWVSSSEHHIRGWRRRWGAAVAPPVEVQHQLLHRELIQDPVVSSFGRLRAPMGGRGSRTRHLSEMRVNTRVDIHVFVLIIKKSRQQRKSAKNVQTLSQAGKEIEMATNKLTMHDVLNFQANLSLKVLT